VYVRAGYEVYCLNADTGSNIWTYPADTNSNALVVVAYGRVYLAEINGDVHCLDAETGGFVWTYETGGVFVDSSPAVGYGNVYIGTQDDLFYCLDAFTGEHVWEASTTGLHNAPALADSNVYVAGTGYMYCFNASNGNTLWNRPLSGSGWWSSPAVADGKIYVGGQGPIGAVVCLDATNNGALLWRFSSVTLDAERSSPAVADGKVYMGSRDGNVYCLPQDDPDLSGVIESDEVIWNYNTGDFVHSSPAVADNMVFIGSYDSTLYAFGPLPAICQVFPVSIDFDTVIVGAYTDSAFTIKNAGEATLSGTISESCDHYSVISGAGIYSLAADESLIVTVHYEPDTSGVHNCTIALGNILCSDVALTGVGEYPPDCWVSPVSVDFDTVLVGSYLDTAFAIANTGGGTLTGTVSESCDQFSVVSGQGDFNLAADETLMVTVRFAPDTNGVDSCTIDLGSTLCDSVFVSGIGEFPPVCWVDPDSVDFGTIIVGNPVDTAIVITNTGGGILKGSVTDSCDQYSIVSGGGAFSLASDETLMVTIRFEPDTSGVHGCSMDLDSLLCNDVFLTGAAEFPPQCWVSTDSIDYGTTTIGNYADSTFAIKNMGEAVLNGTVSESCANYDIISGAGAFGLATGESLLVTVRFEPTLPGMHVCTVELSNVLCADVVLTGMGELPPACWVSADSVVFDTVTVGTYVDSSFVIKNAGGGSLGGTVSESCNHYSIVSGGGAYNLAAGESLTVSVRFGPMTDGEHQCTVDLGGVLCSDVIIVGVGELPPFCGVIPTNLDFGTVAVDSTMDTTFTVINTGVDSLTGTVSESCNHYSILSGGGNYGLAAGESLTVTVRFEPTVSGQHNCIIDVGSALCADVSCTGIGEVPPTCVLSLSSIDFGTVTVGTYADSTFTVTNSGGGILTGTIIETCDHYSIESGQGAYSLSADESLLVVVRFEPTTTGVHNCTIADVCSDVNCYGVGGSPPVCQVNPASLDFGTVIVGTYLDTTFTITNIGSGTLVGAVSESCDQYSIVSGGGAYSLAGGEWVTVIVRYEPDSSGIDICTIETGSILCSDVSCVGDGLLLELRDIAITDVSPSLSNVFQGDSLSIDVTVENRGFSAETFSLCTYYDGIIPNGGFEKDTTGTSFNDLTDWDYELIVNKGNPPIGDDLYVVDDYYFERVKSVYSYLKTKSIPPNPGDNWVSQYLKREGPAFTTADYLTVWISGDGYTTSSRYAWHIELVVTDGVNTYAERIRCDCWGSNEGCNPNHFDYFDESRTGEDGRTWKRYTITIPGNIDKSNVTVKVKHFQASWDGTQASSWYRIDDVYFSDSVGNVWGLIDSTTVTSLLPSGATVRTFTWNTAGVPRGIYAVRSHADPVPEEMETADNTYFNGAVTVALPCTLTITADLGGTTDPSPGTHSYPCSSYVEVAAYSDTCFLFDHWELDGFDAGSANPDSVLLDDNHTLHAVFSPVPVCYTWPDSLDFGLVDVSAYADTTFIIANICGDTLSGNVSETCNHYSIISGAGAFGLAAGESLLVTVRFEPTAIDTHYCTIETGSLSCSDVYCRGIGDEATSVADQGLIPATFHLAQNYPNPFNPNTRIRYGLPEAHYIKLEIFNTRGQKVKTLVDEYREAGFEVVSWDGRNEKGLRVSSGIYFYRLLAGDYVEVKKMVLLK
jgi:outer membrane protein assembly factor BamB